jgi:glutathione S-transferase
MKLYDFPLAPNRRRTRIYLAEKGLSIRLVMVNLREGAQRAPEFLARNPHGSLPVLELDDGTLLTESEAIIEYLEELHPEPPMLGRTPLERARTRRLERLCEIAVLFRVARYVHVKLAPLPGAKPNPAVAEWALGELPRGLRVLEDEVGEFVAGDRVSVADCTLFAAFEFARGAGLALEEGFPRLVAWSARFAQRPSARA